MNSRIVQASPSYDPETYWDSTAGSYPYYPTVRHRKRFILDCLRRFTRLGTDSFVFDYGCGEGGILQEIQAALRVSGDQLGGCDVSATAIAHARKKVASPHLYHGGFPEFDARCSAVVCSEVIEHTRGYLDILEWIYGKLTAGGVLILTTQAGKLHASDAYTGHVQHFTLSGLQSELAAIGFRIAYARLWGFPLFTLQKYMTDVNFKVVREHCLEGRPSLCRRALFAATYGTYFVHDLIPMGPQIYVVAVRGQTA
jgi:SAM-dependent methyltransferase